MQTSSEPQHVSVKASSEEEKKRKKKKINLKDKGQVVAGRMFFFLNRISKLKHSLVAQVPKDRTVSYNFKNISTQ